MFPVSDDNTRMRRLPIAYGLIALNVLVFLLELSGGDQFIKEWAFIPARFAAAPADEAVTLFTAMFMHGGWLHLDCALDLGVT
jgi:membrane associated rhomboid family serine protease